MAPIVNVSAGWYNVPGQKYTFGVVKAAQARADFAVLAERRVLRVHLGAHGAAGLATLRGCPFNERHAAQ